MRRSELGFAVLCKEMARTCSPGGRMRPLQRDKGGENFVAIAGAATILVVVLPGLPGGVLGGRGGERRVEIGISGLQVFPVLLSAQRPRRRGRRRRRQRARRRASRDDRALPRLGSYLEAGSSP